MVVFFGGFGGIVGCGGVGGYQYDDDLLLVERSDVGHLNTDGVYDDFVYHLEPEGPASAHCFGS